MSRFASSEVFAASGCEGWKCGEFASASGLAMLKTSTQGTIRQVHAHGRGQQEAQDSKQTVHAQQKILESSKSQKLTNGWHCCGAENVWRGREWIEVGGLLTRPL